MSELLETTRDLIIERQEDLAREIVERHWKLRPALEQLYGEKASALATNNPGLLAKSDPRRAPNAGG